MFLVCLRPLCALSSSYSPLALAVPLFITTVPFIRRVFCYPVQLWGVRIWKMLLVLSQPCLQRIEINHRFLWTDCTYDIDHLNGHRDVRETTISIIQVIWDIPKSSNDSLRKLLRGQIMLKIELIRFPMIPMKEDDCFCCWIVDSNHLGSLIEKLVTCLINNFSLRTRVSKWNFFCWEILLYLQ